MRLIPAFGFRALWRRVIFFIFVILLAAMLGLYVAVARAEGRVPSLMVVATIFSALLYLTAIFMTCKSWRLLFTRSANDFWTKLVANTVTRWILYVLSVLLAFLSGYFLIALPSLLTSASVGSLLMILSWISAAPLLLDRHWLETNSC